MNLQIDLTENEIKDITLEAYNEAAGCHYCGADDDEAVTRIQSVISKIEEQIRKQIPDAQEAYEAEKRKQIEAEKQFNRRMNHQKRLPFQCGCGNIIFHYAFFMDKPVQKECKNCGKETRQHRYYSQLEKNGSETISDQSWVAGKPI